MASRWRMTVVVMCTLLAAPLAHASIRRWDTGEVIPGTEGIEPGPGVQLDHWNTDDRNLRYANFSGGVNLAHAHFHSSWLDSADFSWANLADASIQNSTLTDANLSGANLARAYLHSSTLSGADLTEAVVTGAHLPTTALGLTRDQVYSTASYRARDLRGIGLTHTDLTDWDFSGHDLTGATFTGSTMTGVNLTGAVIRGTWFAGTTSSGFTPVQLYSTASYQDKNLQGIHLWVNDLTGWDLGGQDLTGAELGGSNLTNADFTGANLTSANMCFFKGGGGNLTDANLSDAILANAYLIKCDLTNAVLTGANLTNADLDLSTLSNADLSGANLKNARLTRIDSLHLAVLDSTTVYNQWTVFPDGFDPVDAGLTFTLSAPGDLNANGMLDAADIDLSAAKARDEWFGYWLNGMFDLNADGHTDPEDHRFWVNDLKHTWFGDANLDGEFNSSDMVQVFAAGKYEQEEEPILYLRGLNLLNPTSWSEGDWNGDGIFDSSDMVTAFADGGYEKGPRTDAVAVPEPGGWLLLVLGALSLLTVRRRLNVRYDGFSSSQQVGSESNGHGRRK